MRVVAVPMLQDNYGWLVVDETSNRAAIVDPAEDEPVLAAVAREGVELVAVLATHHHYDHVGGVEALWDRVRGLEVYGWGADAERIPRLTRPLAEGDTITLGALTGRVAAVPCHTKGHVAYLFEDALFSGDTLFAAGCGRFFEGTAREMYHALYDVIGALPDATRVFCGHEYTVKNLEFAASLEPSNTAIAAKAVEVRARRALGAPSVPTTLGEERTYNPFLRVAAPELRASVAAARPDVDLADPIAVLAAVRAMKDVF
ncbi:hydroxyacylglutathione hydrolase [Myxococcota bacterium]|nr:hydroxyacylglutathione hydrolase [Myxococcota bacterium]